VDPTSVLTDAPALFVRPILCQGGPFEGSTPRSPQALPFSCTATPYALEPDSPDSLRSSGHTGNSTTSLPLDPALAQFPTTTPSADSAHPNGSALLPVANNNGARDLVGSTQLMLSSSVASARAVHGNSGTWLVDVSLSPHETVLFDEVARRYFDLQLAIDLDGEIVSAPIIEPTQSGYRPFDGRIELAGPSQAWAEGIAAALQSGPLSIPLELAHAA
jgi:preprotein translocase subunit SecD